MGCIVRIDEKGRIVYDGLLSSKEKTTVDEVLMALKEEIPEIEYEISEQYGSSVWYKYYLGKVLTEYLERFDIKISERRYFWDEIKVFASQKERKRNEGAKSKTRSFYEQCYFLSQLDKEVIGKLSWRQWQDILDRVSNREDKRIFEWIKAYPEKIREDDWREFEKALHMYLITKDTSVFTQEELISIYNSIMDMCIIWRSLLKEFSSSRKKSAKIKNKSIWSKKYYAKCMEEKKQTKNMLFNKDMCVNVFWRLME